MKVIAAFLLRLARLERATFGSVDRRIKNTKLNKIKTCETAKKRLTPQLTPKLPKQGEVDISELTPDFAEIVAIWPELPEHIKAAIQALVHSHLQGV